MAAVVCKPEIVDDEVLPTTNYLAKLPARNEAQIQPGRSSLQKSSYDRYEHREKTKRGSIVGKVF